MVAPFENILDFFAIFCIMNISTYSILLEGCPDEIEL